MKACERHLPEILTAAGTHGHRPACLFLVADDQQVRQLLQAMFPDFIGNFLISQIGFSAETRVSAAFARHFAA